MAKTKKKVVSKQPAAEPDPLEEGMELFKNGDYVAARQALSEKAQDSGLSDAQRSTADTLAKATRLDRVTVLTGMACLALFFLVAFVTHLKQP